MVSLYVDTNVIWTLQNLCYIWGDIPNCLNQRKKRVSNLIPLRVRQWYCCYSTACSVFHLKRMKPMWHMGYAYMHLVTVWTTRSQWSVIVPDPCIQTIRLSDGSMSRCWIRVGYGNVQTAFTLKTLEHWANTKVPSDFGT